MLILVNTGPCVFYARQPVRRYRVSSCYFFCHMTPRESSSIDFISVHAGYYFAWPRPPEKGLISPRFQPWELKCLKEIGWGPPTCMAIRDNVQDKYTSCFCLDFLVPVGLLISFYVCSGYKTKGYDHSKVRLCF
jgi:hypothetical protein